MRRMMVRGWKHFTAICIALATTVQLVQVQAQTAAAPLTSLSTLTKEEIELLIKDVAASKPDSLNKLKDPESRQVQIESLKQLLAFAGQAQKEGLADNQTNRQELENIRSEVIAVNYDREINKNKGPMPPLGSISDARVKSFWTAAATAKAREDDFERFLRSKLEMLKTNNPQMKDHVLSDEEREQAREFYAKIKIYEGEYKAKRDTLPKQLEDRIDLQTKLQQAQFLAGLYAEKFAAKVKATDSEIDSYISERPELDTSRKKAKAEEILIRAKAGEDFAKLANEYSEDPGNKAADGKPQDGRYQNVKTGVMVPPFERAALALRPGEISPGLVESDFGYHIVKLEKKGPDPDDPKSEVYDVRHILISTTYADPLDPSGRDTPVRTYAREILEAEAEKRAMDDLIRANNVQVAEDFIVPDTAAKKVTTRKKPAPKKKPVRKRR